MQTIQILIPIISSVLLLSLTYLFDKRKQRESEWRKEKLKLYINFVESLSGITDFEKTIESEKLFAKTCNDLHLLSSKNVVDALHKFQESIALSNKTSTNKEKEVLLTNLITEMRRDIGLKPKGTNEVQVKLWTSGIKSTKVTGAPVVPDLGTP